MTQREASSSQTPPGWLRALGLVALALIGATAAYAIAIGVANFARIGV